MSNLEVKGVTTRGGKTTTQDVQDNDTNLHTKEPLVINHDEPVESNEVLTKDQPQKTDEPVVQPTCELQTSPIPFPRRLRKEKEEAQQKKFLENLKQLHINLPFIKALAQMPKYAKFLKDFVILDMPEDSRVPIILGRSFLATARAMIDVFNKKITLRVGDDEVIFDMDQSIKRSPAEDDECYGVDDLDNAINAEAQELLANDTTDSFLLKGLEKSIEQSNLESYECEASDDFNSIRRIEAINTPYPVAQKKAEHNKVEREQLYLASANEIDEKKPELKNLPQHLEYAYLHGDKSFPIIISSKLFKKEKMLILQVSEKCKGAIAWKMSDIKGINPSYCTHKILMEDDYKPVIQLQRRLNPKVQDVVKNEIMKLLDSGLIYPISDSSWVSPIHVVPKKGGMIIVLNDNNELIHSHTVTRWRVCIDYRKFNDATRKDHFPIPFIDQMLERLCGNEYYYFLDGFPRFLQISIAPEDQEKTTFTYPYETFAYR
ncbi:hypothetical protein Tco_1020664 [Tanacetum coccineum]